MGVWDRPGGWPIAVLDGLGTVARTLRLNGDGAFLAAGAAGGRVAVWRADTWEERAVWDAHEDEAAAVAWRGNILATGGGDGRVALWTSKGEDIAETTFEEGPVQGLAWRPDGGRLLVAIGGPDAAIVALRVVAERHPVVVGPKRLGGTAGPAEGAWDGQPVTADQETLPLSHAVVTVPAGSVSVRPTRKVPLARVRATRPVMS